MPDCPPVWLRPTPPGASYANRGLVLATEMGYEYITKNCYYMLMEISIRGNDDESFNVYFEKLQERYPDTELSKSFFRAFDITDIISLKEI